MRTEEFKEWLANRGVVDADAIIRYCTNGEKVYCGGDIDAQFRRDHLADMIQRQGRMLRDKNCHVTPEFKSLLLDSVRAIELYREFAEQNTVVE